MPDKRDRIKNRQASRAASQAAKVPRIDPSNLFEPSKDTFHWSFDSIDAEGPFGWRRVSNSDLYQIMERLKSLETMIWSQITDTGSHAVPVAQFSNLAQDRLRQIELDEETELFSLRIDAKLRIWGRQQGKVLRLVWYDPDHAVCPSLKRGT